MLLEIPIQLFFFPFCFRVIVMLILTLTVLLLSSVDRHSLLSFPLVHFQNDPKYLKKRKTQVLISFDEISTAEVDFGKFSRSSEVLFSFSFFFCLRLFDGICFQYSQILVIFLFSQCSGSFLFWQFYFFHFCLLPLFIKSMAYFSKPNYIPTFWLYILIVCIRFSSSFSLFVNTEVWVTARLLNALGFFLVFLLISVVLWSERTQF